MRRSSVLLCFRAWSLLLVVFGVALSTPINGTAAGDGLRTKKYGLLDGTKIQLQFPVSWRAEQVGIDGLFPSLNLAARRGDRDFVIKLTPLPEKREIDLESLVRAQGKQKLGSAVQDEIVLMRVDGVDGFGFLYRLTDRSPEKGTGHYGEVLAGAMRVGGLVVAVTVLFHAGDDLTASEAISVLERARHIR